MERVKKIILMAAAFAVVVGMTFINNNVAYADNAKTVNIHYHRDDANYSGYTIAVWDEYTQGTDYELKANGNEGVVSYTCSSAEATVVTFVVKPKDGSDAEYGKNRTVDISEVTGDSIDVYVKSGVDNFSTKGFDELGGIEVTTQESTSQAAQTTEATTQESTTANEETTAGEETTVAADTAVANNETQPANNATVSDAKNKDYSVGTGTVIIVDIVSIIVLGVGSYLICNKKQQ
ncbi:MAG: pullulanase-associated domain-containing protein [Lachnospiraceae bacterium]|jgi:hypothetical protein|nr:pullulanase-associated domain-containing protein [Lachnospiraceae bacterium]